MLSLDDPYWNELRHAYGAAGDIPALAVAKGHHALAGALMNLDSYWIAKINSGDGN
jgi:hypothetical protein